MNKYLIFLDDERNFEDVTWIKYPKYKEVFTIRRAVDFLFVISNIDDFSEYEFSFDHDIASYDPSGKEITGYDCVKHLCNLFMDKSINPESLLYNVHSMNPVGKKNINCYISNFKNSYRTYSDL